MSSLSMDAWMKMLFPNSSRGKMQDESGGDTNGMGMTRYLKVQRICTPAGG